MVFYPNDCIYLNDVTLKEKRCLERARYLCVWFWFCCIVVL